jgi:hypothetical protein
MLIVDASDVGVDENAFFINCGLFVLIVVKLLRKK